MSYDIELCDPVTGKVIELPTRHLVAGGTYVLGGTTELWCNVTWNYAARFRDLFGAEGIRALYNMTGVQSQPVLRHALSKLNKNTEPADYWEPTDGNVYRALAGLLSFAELRPDGVWSGD